MAEFTDQSTAPGIDKILRILRGLSNPETSAYYYSDGFPRHNAIKQDAEAAIVLIERLRAAADLLARARDGCRCGYEPYQLSSDDNDFGLFLNGPPDLLCELAAFLTHETKEEQDNGNV